MSNSATIEKMKEMKFFGMQKAFELSMETNTTRDFTTDEFLAYLIEAEYNDRQTRKMNRLIRSARFRYAAEVEQVHYPVSRGLDKNQLLRLATGNYIQRKESIIITGPTGVGKSYIASALGHQACTDGYKVLYYNASKLFSLLKMSKADGSYLKYINRIEKQDLLILDDFGLHPLDEQNKLALLEIIEDRHGKRSTIITSQIPVKKWHELLDNQTIADAILDRIVHTAHRIELKGESMRKKMINK
ncbi:MAG: ATP-binding protein [Bacteroidetes bacterium]|nr:ATP-binding protein [Bacteroidota bacterium]